MSFDNLLALILALAVLVYLVYALIRPERL
jgi:K+-transporting ATPase KdpF subunit